jgi:hypothetical protein
MASINYREFASRIKSQYPQLADLDDLTIAKRIVSTKPELQGKVFFGDEDPATLQAKHDANVASEANQPRTFTERIAQAIPQGAYDFGTGATRLGLRAVPAFIGGTLTPLLGPLAPVMGGVVGEGAGQLFEKELGEREKLTPGVMAAEGGLNALTGGVSNVIKPASKLTRVMTQGLEGGLFGQTSTDLRSLIEKGQLAEFSETLPATAFGAGLGAVGQGVSELAQARKAKLDTIRAENAALEAEAQALSALDNPERGSFSTRPVSAGRIEEPYRATPGIQEGAEPLPPSRQLPAPSAQPAEKAIELSPSSKVKPAQPRDVLTDIEEQPIENWIERHMGLDQKTADFVNNVHRTSAARKAAEQAEEPVQSWAQKLFAGAMPKGERGSITLAPRSTERLEGHGGVGGKGASVEELNRPGVFYKVGRSGVTYLGKQVDASLKPGEAIMQSMPDGTVKTYATEGLNFKQAESMFGSQVKKAHGQRGSINMDMLVGGSGKSPEIFRGKDTEAPPAKFGKPARVKAEPGYLYHGTNEAKARSVAESGKLSAELPETTWSDGDKGRRVNFSLTPSADSETLLRVKRGAQSFRRSKKSGEIFSTSDVESGNVEYLGDDKKWHPLSRVADPDGVRAEAQELIDDLAKDYADGIPTKDKEIIFDEYDRNGIGVGAGYRTHSGTNVNDIPVLQDLAHTPEAIANALKTRKGPIYNNLVKAAEHRVREWRKEANLQEQLPGKGDAFEAEGGDTSFNPSEFPLAEQRPGERGSISLFPKKKQTYQLSPDEQKVDAGFAEPPTTAKSVKEKVKAGWDATINAMTDRSIYTKRAQDIVEKEHGGPLPQIARAREEALRWPGRLARVEEELNEKIAPHLKALDSEEFQAVKRMIAAEDAITKANATGNQNRSYSGGVSWQEAQQALVDMENGLGPARFAKVKAAADAVFQYNHFLLKKDLDSGNISQALYNELTTKFDKYNRVRIAEFIKQSHDKPVGGAAEFFVNSDTGLRKLSEKGTSRRMLDPLESMIMSAFETENRVAKNDVANAIASWKQLSPTMDRVITRVPADHKFTNAEAKMQARFGGKLETYSIPKELEGIFKYGTTMDGRLARAFSLASGKALLEAGAVRRNPLFLTTNALVDATQSMIRGLSPKDLVKGYISAFKNDKWAKDAKLAGSTMGTGFYSRTPKDILSEISSKGHLEIRDAKDLKRFADLAAFGWVSKIGEKIENAPRIAAFRKEFEKSGDELKAAIAGRDITVDFAKGGWLAKILNQAIPFFNIGIQGAAVIPRQLGKAEGRNRMLAGMAGLAVVGTGLEAYNRTFESYKDIPQYVKDAGLVFMLTEKKGEDGKTTPYYLNMNLREFAPVVTAVREGFNRVYGDEGKSIPEFVAAVAESGMPIKGQGVAGKAAQVIPPSLKAPIQVGFNKDFYRGRDINPPDEMRINTPEDRFGPYQTGMSKWLSKHGLGKAGLSPRDIESVAGTIGGGGAMQAMREIDNVGKVAKGEVKDARDVPGLSSFISQVYKSQGGEQQSRKYKSFTKDSTKLTRDTLKEVESFEEYRQLTPAQKKTIQRQISSRADKMVKFKLGLLDEEKAAEYDGPTSDEELLDLAKDLLAEIE